MAIDDGGQAFPTPGDEETIRRDGMSLRDYFAGQALVGWIARNAMGDTVDDVAIAAYATADAMLKARNKAEA